jgi:hypothetical protein
MRCRVHVLDRLTGEVLPATLTTEHSASSYGQPVIVLEDGQAVDSWQYEVLPFPMRDELGAGGTP